MEGVNSANLTEGVQAIGSVGDFINRYGFMVMFCALVLVLMFLFFVMYSKNLSKKSDTELDILQKEREAAINQNNQMFNLVTEVQTNQIAQLQEMTSLLKDINKTVDSTHTHIEINETDIKKIEEDIIHIDDNYDNIERTLSEILTFVKQTDSCNKEVYQKVLYIEKSLDVLVKQRKSNKQKVSEPVKNENETVSN